MRAVRKEMECLKGGKRLVISDDWPGSPAGRAAQAEEVVFEVFGPMGGMQGIFGLSREDAGDLGRFLVEYYGEG